jgi:uncharacterized protein YfaS (alpha-2-macroglobulin family)
LLTYTTGETPKIDITNKIIGRGGIVKDLEDINYFKLVKVDPEFGTLVWPNDVDFCPDVLYCEAMGKSLSHINLNF